MEKSFCFSFTRYNYRKNKGTSRPKTNTDGETPSNCLFLGAIPFSFYALSAGFLHGGYVYKYTHTYILPGTIFACLTFAVPCSCFFFIYIFACFLVVYPTNSIEGWQRKKFSLWNWIVVNLAEKKVVARKGWLMKREKPKASGYYGYYLLARKFAARTVSTC